VRNGVGIAILGGGEELRHSLRGDGRPCMLFSFSLSFLSRLKPQAYATAYGDIKKATSYLCILIKT
jgi:hypothetical protein